MIILVLKIGEVSNQVEVFSEKRDGEREVSEVQSVLCIRFVLTILLLVVLRGRSSATNPLH